MVNLKKQLIRAMSVLSAGFMTAGFAVTALKQPQDCIEAEASLIRKTDATIKTNQEKFYDTNVIYKLPETVKKTDDISVIVTMNVESVMDSHAASSSNVSLSEYVNAPAGKAVAANVARERKALLAKLNKTGISYVLGEEYDTIFGGFEVTIKAKDFEKLNKLYAEDATLMVGEVYAPAQTVIIENDVEVYEETGIFDSSTSEYQGDGVVVAVLDTGLDYTHTAFSVSNFTTTDEAFTLDSVSKKVNQTVAADFTPGLTGQDVYLNKKVPFAYDYADKDPDVLPINSDHGTHVAGIIAGKDDTITGVAPNAQLAIMKVFSDAQQGAKDSWILSALEDCIVLGVDVINMSLGSGCGFTREVDKDNKNDVYDKIREAGISLVTAAGNDYNATHGSTENGSNPLTTNPDSGVVGAPSTYEGALCVASVDGVKTPYLKYGEDIIYFTEASTADADVKKNFVSEILSTLGGDVQSHDFEYVTIPGVGRSSDYPEDDSFYAGKIVLVKRGQTTFEDKVRVALLEKGASGIIIYNNVSGDISMSVGANVGAVCSISQDEGEKLAAAGTGVITISKSQAAGPFMSDFSSWGPTSDLKIKPEITAHGGEILSAVPGQEYEKLSGTSMAAPNQAGAAALIRQYVKYSGVFGTETEMEAKPVEVTNIVNQLMMSTTDIVYNKNGLPYAVRKQGAGLANIKNAATTESYLTTFDKEGKLMDKTKLELGDDKARTGVYEFSFNINNISTVDAVYNIGSLLTTEGVSPTYTIHGDTTSTQDGYLLDKGTTTVVSVSGAGSNQGNTVTVSARNTATVTVRIALAEEEKQYINASFAYGMYVEGFITLKASGANKVNLNVPMLAFFGDWTEAPIFDEEYYDTHKDEINAGIDPEDKLTPDAYATRVIGGLYSDYITTMGEYYFKQDPSTTQIAASKEHIAISNQQSDYNSTVNSVNAIWAGMLRNAKEVHISVVDDVTGEVIFNKTEYNQRKSSSSGSTVHQSQIDVDFSAIEHNLKNNTRYTVKVTSYIDYGAHEDQKSVRDTFEFPLYVDIEAPVITDVQYYTEYDQTTKKTKLFADLSVYDNHYAMAMQLGQIVQSEDPQYMFSMETFGKYITPVYSSYNSTSKVTVELTDYVSQLKNSMGLNHKGDGTNVVYNNNSFIATCYDYAMNSATYELRLPDEVLAMYFTEETITLNPNETLDISTVLNIFPAESWLQTLDFETTDAETVAVVNNTLIAKKSGSVTLKAIGYNAKGEKVQANVEVKVLAEGDEGYYGKYTLPEVNKFTLTGYKTNKAYYSVSSDEREIGVIGSTNSFGDTLSLSMFPGEEVTLDYVLDSYFPDKTSVSYKVGNERIATVDENGKITALAEGNTIVSVNVKFDGESTLYNERVSVKVKDPFTSNAIYLMSYKGLGGEVVIPDDRGITTIYEYAFSGYEYVEKDLKNGDVIDEEDPYHLKQSALGEHLLDREGEELPRTIKKVVIPEGVTHIDQYAFAKLTALEEVVLPSTLINIGVAAFEGCEKLTKINLENVKFINERAFSGCNLQEIDLRSVVAIGNYTFKNCKLNYVELPKSSQSLGIGAFYGNEYLASISFAASKIKIGANAFEGCTKLSEMNINAAVIAPYAFMDCQSLTTITLGKDVAVIGEYAFAGTKVAKFNVDFKNEHFATEEDGAMLYNKDKTELVMVAPMYSGSMNTITTNAKTIKTGAFSGNTKVFNVVANEAEYIGPYAFADCTNLKGVQMDKVVEIDSYAFANTSLATMLNLENIERIGDYAFAFTNVSSVSIADNTEVGKYAFYLNVNLESVTIGNNVKLGEGAFYCPITLNTVENLAPKTINEAMNILNNYYVDYKYYVKDDNGDVIETYTYKRYDFTRGSYSNLKNLTIGANVEIGDFAFAGNAKLETLDLDADVTIGNYAFYDAAGLSDVDLSQVKVIGDYAFSGTRTQDFWMVNNNVQDAYELKYINGEIYITDYVYSYYAPVFETANLTNVTAMGEGAFAYNGALKSVTLGNGLNSVPKAAFASAKALEEITLPATITQLGDFAFYASSLKNIDLTNITAIGANALALTKLETVTLKDGVTVGDSAFAYVETLATVNNLKNVKTIGDYAFMYTALETLELTNVESIGDFAFRQAAVTEVTFGDKLTALGENPFEGCAIQTFAREENTLFNDKVVGVALNGTYNVSASVKVINGVLYEIAPNGSMVLVSYPMAKADKDFTVEEGTVRISARAFFGAPIQSVILPSTLKALGDKAFYGCEKLSLVVFKSYEAPLLEEEYDEQYLRAENLPYGGGTGENKGLGIVDYYMWNVTSNFNNFYFGANFVDYIGHVSNKIVMVKPANGQHYDTFIFSQYFGATVDGDNAATEPTLKVIGMIAALPDNITLADEAAVKAAREAFDKLPSFEQKDLVWNYSKLQNAESTIEYLKLRDLPPETPEDPADEKTPLPAHAIICIVVGSVLLAGCGVAVFFLIRLSKKKTASAAVNVPVAEKLATTEETAKVEVTGEMENSEENTEE